MANHSLQGCTSPPEREMMQSLLEDTHPWPNWWFVDEGVSHWKDCPACRSDFPDGESRLAGLRMSLEQTTRDEISIVRKFHLAVKHSAGVENEEGAQCRVLAHLAAAGDQLAEQLWSVNTSGVPYMGFCPLLAAIDIDNDEGSLVLIGALDFFMTLSQEDQDFVAAATAARQLFDRTSSLMEDARRLTADEEDLQKRYSRIYEYVIANSPISPGSFITILELGTPNIVQEYLRVARSRVAQHDRKEATLSAKGDSLSRTAIDELGRELLHNFDDFSDSMKATQMEVLHRLEQWGSSPDSDDFRLGILASDAILSSRTLTARKHPSNRTNPEHDWSWVLHEFARGKDAAKLARKLTSRHADRPNSMYYAHRTADVASARLRLGESIPIDDAVILLEGRRRLEIPLVLSRARARKAYRLYAGGEGIIPDSISCQSKNGASHRENCDTSPA